MASGGVTSINDPIDSVQFSPEELSAITSEAARWGKYVMAHVYSPEAIKHAVDCGVRSLEHCNLLDDQTADLVAAKGCFIVPTLITYDTMKLHSQRFGLTRDQVEKLMHVAEAGSAAVELCVEKGIPMGLGTDLLGAEAQQRQSEELRLRADIQSNHEVLKSATLTNAQLLEADGDVGKIFVLDMGEPIRIMDLAKQMIRLTGLRPGADIKIEIIGIRPGEKLFEEVFHGAEPPVATESPGLLLAAPRPGNLSDLMPALAEIQEALSNNDTDGILNIFQKLIPEYQSEPGAGAKAAAG